jgi:hypothetical protein
MPIPFTILSGAVSGLINGPLNKVIDCYVADLELRRKLKAELETSIITHLGKSLDLQKEIVLAEVKSEHWLTRSWRPALMLVLMFFLLLVGLVIPLADLAAGYPIPFNPRWQALPEERLRRWWGRRCRSSVGRLGGNAADKMCRKGVRGLSLT